MSDIVERLREVAERPDANYPAIMEQAAARIEQLEGALREIKYLRAQKKGSVSYAMASIARAALEDKCTSL